MAPSESYELQHIYLNLKQEARFFLNELSTNDTLLLGFTKKLSKNYEKNMSVIFSLLSPRMTYKEEKNIHTILDNRDTGYYITHMRHYTLTNTIGKERE